MFLIRSLRLQVLRLCAIFIFCTAVASCSKNPDTVNNTTNGNPISNNNNNINQLQPFTVSVRERVPQRAIITWTTVVNNINNDTVKYKVIINDRVVHSNLSRTVDTLLQLSKDTLYNGKVIASVGIGDSVIAPFVLETYNGYIYITGYLTNKIGCYGSYWDGVSYINYWEIPFADPQFAPAISNDTLFVTRNFSSSAPPVCAINANSGSIIWSALPPTQQMLDECAPTYSAGKVFACTNQGMVALSSATGQVLWTFQSPTDQLRTRPVVANDKVYVGAKASTGNLFALDLATGNQRWSIYLNSIICARPLVTQDLVIFGLANGMVYALNQNTGQTVWTRNLHGINNFGSNDISPILVDNRVVVYNRDAGVCGLNLQTGAIEWSYSDLNNFVYEMATGSGMIFLLARPATTNDKIIALNSATGQFVWESYGLNVNSITSLIHAKDKLYFQENYRIRVADPYTGHLEATVSPDYTYILGYAIKINGLIYYDIENGNYKGN